MAVQRVESTTPSESGDAVIDSARSAHMAGLRYVSDSGAGIRRRRAGRHFSYVAPDGTRLQDERELQRIRALAIPPAWTGVWICPNPRGHVQATGRDAKGRKQYRYHPKWREVRDETKYHRMIAFGQALPDIRAAVDRDLARQGLPREKVIATIVRLLEGTLIRVGNEEYARENRSYGLTTLRTRHIDIEGSTLRFHFKGKSGISHDVGIRDRRMAAVIRRMRDLPGQHLFQYVDDEGETRQIESNDVNEYLREVGGQEFTAKDFRTWAGTLLAARALQEFEEAASESQARKNIVQAIESVATQLGNTPAVCRKCYVHPEVLNAYLEGTTLRTVMQRARPESADSLSELDPEEAAVMALLHERLARSTA